jgi:hypothetical protein
MTSDGPDDAEVVRTAAEAAEGAVFAHYRKSAVRDLDVTVSFEDGRLSVDVYLNPGDDADPDPEAVVEEAVAAAESAVDDLFA